MMPVNRVMFPAFQEKKKILQDFPESVLFFKLLLFSVILKIKFGCLN